MNPLMEAFLAKYPEYKGTRSTLFLAQQVFDFLCPAAVVIGGKYRHFKGKEYIVTDLVRDAERWEDWLVVYHEITDGNHRASRRLNDFIGVHHTGVRRFMFVPENQITA